MTNNEIQERLLFGTCRILSDAEECIELKSLQGWKVLVKPFPWPQPDPHELSHWAFVLHRFHLIE